MGEVAMKEPLRFWGVMPAKVLPFRSDLAIDEPAYRRHLRWLADTRGVTGIVANGHASEVSSLNRDERKHSLAIALDELGGTSPVIAGIYSDGTHEAVELARHAPAAGAGGAGAFSGWGRVRADLQAELFEAFSKGDRDGAGRINGRLAPLVSAFYAPPFVDMHNRMKEALVLLGGIPAAHVRPPLTPVGAAEREAIRPALVASGLVAERR